MKSGVTKPSLVERAKQALVAELGSGRYTVGEPLPTHREWAARLRVSTFTVLRALNELKSEGLVESSEGSYTYLRWVPSASNLPARPIPSSTPATLSLWMPEKQDLRRLRHSIALRRFHKTFCERHRDVRIEERWLDGPIEEMQATVLAHFVHYAEPTLARTKQTYLPFLIAQEAVAPFRGSENFAASLNEDCRRVCSRDGELYLLPTNLSHSLLLWNRKRFREAGLDPETSPRDWEAFELACQRLSRANGGQPAFHLSGIEALVWWLMHLTWQSLPDRPGDPLDRVDWNGPAAREAIAFLARLHAQGLVRVHTRDLATFASRLMTDEVALVFDAGGFAAQMAQLGDGERFGLGLFPRGPNGRSFSPANCGGWVLNARAAQPQQQAGSDYAIALERWQHEGEGGPQMQRLGVWGSLFSVFQDEEHDRHLVTRVPRSWREVLSEARAQGRWEPAEADWEKAVLGKALEPMLVAGEPVSVERMQSQVRLALFEAALPDRLSTDATTADGGAVKTKGENT